MIIKNSADSFSEVVVQDTVSLKELRQELQALRDEPALTPPTNAELVDWAKEEHPFFKMKQARRTRIDELREKINTYEIL